MPFAEYLPGRSWIQKIVTRYAHDQPNDFVHGKTVGVFTIKGPVRSYRIGDVICFEVAYDGLVRDVVSHGAQLIVVQTNNASFGRSGETYQQLAMGRIRAVEHSRSVVVAATSGLSAIIRPDGTLSARSSLFTAESLVESVPLRSSTTISDRLGGWTETVLVTLGALGLLLAVNWRRTRVAGSVSRRPAQRLEGDGTTRGYERDRVLVCIPTYNERDNLASMLSRVRAATPRSTFWSSTTAAPTAPARSPIRQRRRTRRCTSCIARRSPGWAPPMCRVSSGVLIGATTSSSRWTPMAHISPSSSRLLGPLDPSHGDPADVVLGSRYVDGGRSRTGREAGSCCPAAETLTCAWCSVCRCGMPPGVTGPTAVRCCASSSSTEVASTGYCFQVDLAWQAWRAGFHVVEVPITFIERTMGESKMSKSVVAEAFWRVAWWGIRSRPAALRERSAATHRR